MWVRQMDTWSIWLDPEGYLKIMWGYGIPGAGKTILASIVINTLEAHARASTSSICVNYIYFRYSDHAKATVKGFLELLVKQTVERHPHCLPLFDEVCARHVRENTQPSEHDSIYYVPTLTPLPVANMVTFCILDALDEAPSTIQLEILQKLAALDVKLFITSRPLKTVEAHFPDAHRFRIIAQDQDIDLHIDKDISRSADLRELLEEGDPSLRNEIATTIKAKCSGMFLHASLQLKALRECTSVHEVQETLATFSTEIEDLYLETWKRIRSQTQSKVLLAKRVLLWVINATWSLTIEELRYALATSPETHKFESSRLVQEGTLIGLCRGLVIVEGETRLVRLVHYTAKDILERLTTETFPQPHALLSAVCLARLTDSGLQGRMIDGDWELRQALKAEPILSYAYDSWFIHAQNSIPEPLTAGWQIKCFESSRGFSVHIPQLCRFWVGSKILDVLGPLHLVSFFNLPIAFAGPDSLRDPNQRTPRQHETALNLACMQGHHKAVKELLQLPDILVNTAKGVDGTTALMWASANGHEGVVRVLIACPSLEINATDNEGWTALIYASFKGRKSVVALLLSHPDIDVSLEDRNHHNALLMASQEGHEEVVTLLLSHPDVDVNAANQDEETALTVAARRGQEAIVKLLLAHSSIQVGARELEAARAGHDWTAGMTREARLRIVSLLEEFLESNLES
ncbi:hypothetical protein BKA70DRAFT_1192724 [Coprinopsis sp. MPI-PUGE-AT-0042]|nr:hypothetical protein BKA70DRAFT_1192724 [Coprinopsis sp. MPI-PUGE-AT-0042]